MQQNLDESYFQNKRHLEVFDLSKENRFNITGEFTVDIKDEKQNYKFVAIHPNRTIEWISEYNSVDKNTYQSSRIELAKNIWLGYNIEMLNHTQSDHESQEIKMKISYPARDISLGGLYFLKDDSFDTDLTVEWLKKELQDKDDENDEDRPEPKESKTIQGKFQWRDLEASTKTKDHQNVLLALKHPSFDKDVTLKGSYHRDEFKTAKIAIDFEYTEDEDHHAKFRSEVKNLSEEVGYKNYTISAVGSHMASDFNLIFDGSIGQRQSNYKLEATGSYKRGYLPDMELEMVVFADTDMKEIKIYVRMSTILVTIKIINY